MYTINIIDINQYTIDTKNNKIYTKDINFKIHREKQAIITETGNQRTEEGKYR